MTREEAIKILTRERDEDIFGGWTPHRKRIHEAFTLAIETLKDRPKGEWIKKEGIHGAVYCSECNYELRVNNTNFCPNCGADMRPTERSEE